MSDKELSGEEKRRQMKEDFKKELQQRKEFMNKVKGLRRMQSINKALDDMTPEDDTQDWIDRLNTETAFSEAKTEMALDSAHAAAEKSEEEARFQMSEAEMQKLAAEEMVRKMKAEMAAEAEAATAGTSEVSNDGQGGGLLNVEVQEDGSVTEKEVPKEDDVTEGPRRGMLDA